MEGEVKERLPIPDTLAESEEELFDEEADTSIEDLNTSADENNITGYDETAGDPYCDVSIKWSSKRMY